MSDGDREATLREEIRAASWYHTIELPGGLVTPGEYDLRPTLARLPIPASLAGRRCLDVGTRDGFYAFTMEQRGAEVVAIDLDDPRRYDWPWPIPDFDEATRRELDARSRTFALAHRALCSRVELRYLSVYDLDPGDVGLFDFAVLGTLLLHLRDPVGALAALRSVLRGRLLLAEPISLSLSLLRRGPAAALSARPEPFWWIPNAGALRRYAEAAGFRVLATSRPYLVPNGAAARHPPLRSGRLAANVARLALQRLGAPHVWLLAEPRSAASG
jgi:tRNA (mo5U34)-methyltransferase